MKAGLTVLFHWNEEGVLPDDERIEVDANRASRVELLRRHDVAGLQKYGDDRWSNSVTLRAQFDDIVASKVPADAEHPCVVFVSELDIDTGGIQNVEHTEEVYYRYQDRDDPIGESIQALESFDQVDFGNESQLHTKCLARIELLRQLGAPEAIIQGEEKLLELLQQSDEEPPAPELPEPPGDDFDDFDDFEEAEEDPFRYVEQEEDWVVFSRDGTFISSPDIKARALDIRQKLEDDGVPARIAKESDVQRALEHWQNESVPV